MKSDFKNLKYDNIFFSGILFCLLPFFLITGPFLSDLAVSLIAILFLTNKKIYIKLNIEKYFKNFFFYFFILFFIYLIFTSLISDYYLYSFKKVIFYFRFFIFSLAVWYLLDEKKIWLKYFFYCILFCFIILIFDGYFQYFFEKNLLGMKPVLNHRISSFFGDELILGSYLSRLFPILLGLIFYFIKKTNLIFYLILFVGIISVDVLVFLSGERSAFFYINLSTLMFIVFMSNHKLFRLVVYISTLLIIILMTSIFPDTKARMVNLTLAQTGLFTENKILFSPQHERIYNTGIEIIKDKPILGSGPNTFRKECLKYEILNSENFRCTTHPHNTYLQLFLETGIFGFFMICLLFFIVNYLLLKNLYFKITKKKVLYFDDLIICLLISLYISLFPFLPSGNFFNNYLSSVYFLPTGILLWKFNQIKNKH